MEGIWTASTYIFYNGQEYKLNDPAFFDTSIISSGEVQNGNRVFAAQVDTLFEISLKISCVAPSTVITRISPIFQLPNLLCWKKRDSHLFEPLLWEFAPVK
jgi:hypothetical protein